MKILLLPDNLVSATFGLMFSFVSFVHAAIEQSWELRNEIKTNPITNLKSQISEL